MKRKLILLPTLLTTITPVISLVSCKHEEEKGNVIISDETDSRFANISTPEIILNNDLIINYEITDVHKTLDKSKSWIDFNGSRRTLSRYTCIDNTITIPKEDVTTYKITICLKCDPDPDKIYEIKNTGSLIESDVFNLEEDKYYELWISSNPFDGDVYLEFIDGETVGCPMSVSDKKVFVNGKRTQWAEIGGFSFWALGFEASADLKIEIFFRSIHPRENLKATLTDSID